MAEPEHLAILKSGVPAWNEWRQKKPLILPNLRKADLKNGDYSGANFNDTNLRRAHLNGATLDGATFRRADLRRAQMADASLIGADFTSSTLIKVNFQNADLRDSLVFGVSVWNVNLEGADQRGLIVSKKNAPMLIVDDLEVAQFVYLMVNNQKLRDVITTIGQRAVLILGRFSPEKRKLVLDGIADKLRGMGFMPIVFDFEPPDGKDLTETIQVLAGLSLFVVVDITAPRSSPLELQATVPNTKIPFVPIIEEGEQPFAMFKDLADKYHWLLDEVIAYGDVSVLLDNLKPLVVEPAMEKHAQIEQETIQHIKPKTVAEKLAEIAAGK